MAHRIDSGVRIDSAVEVYVGDGLGTPLLDSEVRMSAAAARGILPPASPTNSSYLSSDGSGSPRSGIVTPLSPQSLALSADDEHNAADLATVGLAPQKEIDHDALFEAYRKKHTETLEDIAKLPPIIRDIVKMFYLLITTHPGEMVLYVQGERGLVQDLTDKAKKELRENSPTLIYKEDRLDILPDDPPANLGPAQGDYQARPPSDPIDGLL